MTSEEKQELRWCSEMSALHLLMNRCGLECNLHNRWSLFGRCVEKFFLDVVWYHSRGAASNFPLLDRAVEGGSPYTYRVYIVYGIRG